MKFNYLTLILLLFFFSSCYTWKRFDREIGANSMMAKEKGNKYFVKTKDGMLYEVSNDFNPRKSVTTTNKTVIKSGDITAYQNDDGYFIKYEGRFLNRIIQGSINGYKGYKSETTTTREYSPATGNVTATRRTESLRPVYYVQKGDGEIKELSAKTVKEMVQDNAAVMPIIDEYERVQRSVRLWRIINTTAVVGGAVLAGTSGLKDDGSVTGVGYGSVALMAGGIGSGVFNRQREGKNKIKLFEAINEYNRMALAKAKKENGNR